MNNKNTWIIIPAYNEARRIKDVILKCRKFGSVVVVDDGSKDNTFEIAGNCGVKVLRHIINMGKGAALKTGCEFGMLHNAGAFVFIDSDGQHDPSEIPLFLKALEKAEIVFGVRKFNKNMPAMMKLGNWFITSASRFLFKIDIKDTQCGYKAFTKHAYEKIKWTSNDYSVESEIIAKASKNKLSYREVPIKTLYSEAYKGTTVLHGIKIVKDMFWWRLSW